MEVEVPAAPKGDDYIVTGAVVGLPVWGARPAAWFKKSNSPVEGGPENGSKEGSGADVILCPSLNLKSSLFSSDLSGSEGRFAFSILSSSCFVILIISLN